MTQLLNNDILIIATITLQITMVAFLFYDSYTSKKEFLKEQQSTLTYIGSLRNLFKILEDKATTQLDRSIHNSNLINDVYKRHNKAIEDLYTKIMHHFNLPSENTKTLNDLQKLMTTEIQLLKGHLTNVEKNTLFYRDEVQETINKRTKDTTDQLIYESKLIKGYMVSVRDELAQIVDKRTKKNAEDTRDSVTQLVFSELAKQSHVTRDKIEELGKIINTYEEHKETSPTEKIIDPDRIIDELCLENKDLRDKITKLRARKKVTKRKVGRPRKR